MVWSATGPRIRELVSEYYEPLYRYAYRLTASAPHAEDLTQETFCRAQAQWRQVRNAEKPRAWLFAILRNCYLRELRDRRGVRHLPLNCVEEPHTEPIVLADIVDSQLVGSALQMLPEPYRTPIILYYFEDFSYKEIADHVGVPIGTVMSRIARAKVFLRRRLEGQIDFTGAPHGL